MQHLLLALAIITLTLIAGNGRGKTSLDNSKVSMKREKPAINNADRNYPQTNLPSFFQGSICLFIKNAGIAMQNEQEVEK
jgi:hypothetical protein